MDQNQVQKIMNLKFPELIKQVEKEYLKVYKAETFLYFEIRFYQSTNYHYELETKHKCIKKLIEYFKFNETLKNIIQSYQLEKKYELYLNDNEAWLSQHLKEMDTSLDIRNNISKNNYLRVI